MATQLSATPGPIKAAGAETDYVADVESLKNFLRNFEARDEQFDLKNKYMDLLQEVADRKSSLVRIALDDVTEFDEALATRIAENTWRYVDLASTAVDAVIPMPSEDADVVDDVLDVLVRQRQALHQEGRDGTVLPESANNLPPSLLRRWNVAFDASSKAKVVPMRSVRAPEIGRLLQVKGMVTRVTDVKPKMSIVTYTCDTCGNEVYQEVTGNTFMPIEDCVSETCRTNRVRGKLHLETRGSRFTAYQEIRIQENATDVPVGHTPRQMTIHVRGALTRTCTAGDTVTVGGIFLPTPITSVFRRAGLIADVYLEAMSVTKEKKGYGEMVLDDDVVDAMREEVAAGGMYEKLARSIAPEIYGLSDIKKALLLQLVGGVTRTMGDGMKIRGDVNICLVGDPGVAKSQLLKHVSMVAPRGVYTSGKGASGVGLTAAVLRDPVTQDFVLEGGALVLADNGICCIDEFDKMEDSDRTAIHEVMEQQTVSIAKAGINTTLNARTAVLAAANPQHGRYDARRSVLYNVNLPAALLSRFDLLYLLMDRANVDRDRQLAEHVLTVHRTRAPPPPGGLGGDDGGVVEVVEPRLLRAFISTARTYEPSVPESLSSDIVDAYAELRNGDRENANDDTHTTARTLLAILRLSQALARVHFRSEVAKSDFDEAVRLMRDSKASIEDAADDDERRLPASSLDRCFHLISELRRIKGGVDRISVEEIVQYVARKSVTRDTVEECIAENVDLNLLIDTGRGASRKIHFVMPPQSD